MFNAENDNSEKQNINFSIKQVEEEMQKLGSSVSQKFSKCSSRFRKKIFAIIKSTKVIESQKEEEIEEIDGYIRKISKLKSLNKFHDSHFSNELSNNDGLNHSKEQKLENQEYNNENKLYESYKFNANEDVKQNKDEFEFFEKHNEENDYNLEENDEKNNCTKKKNSQISLKEEINEFGDGEGFGFGDYVDNDF